MSHAEHYDQYTPREHILERPDSYIGSIDTNPEHRWIYNDATGLMEWRSVSFCPGFLKIFDEILVNALDHRVRQNEFVASGVADAQPVKHIDVTLTPTRIAVRNDGDGIPVGVNTKTNLRVPEMIFGNLLTSSNYDKTKQKIVGGKNGFGAKLTNIYSNEFTVETVDHREKKKYVQTWTSNMITCGAAKITASSGKPYTELSYTPDLTRFKWNTDTVPTSIPKDMLDAIATRVVDAAACAGKECRVTLNGKPVATNTFPKYIGLYLKEDNGSVGTAETEESKPAAGGGGKRFAYEAAGERWEIGAILTRDLHGDAPPKERNISFVNGIATRRGGKHVDYVVDKILPLFCEVAKKKRKIDVTPNMLRDSIVWFVNSTIVDPSFDTQTKETLTTLAKNFGSTPTVSPKFCDQLIKIGLLEEAEALFAAKTARDVKKTDGKKRATLRGIPKLDDADWAGTAKSAECTLILTEGDSAKTTAISGLKIVGRERYGVFPLKGKILNVKDMEQKRVTANQEITYIKQILGLEDGKVYTDLKQLRYGRVMIMTDQDVDGSHIKGLLMNLFHTKWPSLLRLGFVCCLMTPLLKATRGKTVHCFYSETEYEDWKTAHNNGRGWNVKYYKGLGTSTAQEACDYFRNMNMVEYTWDPTSDEHIDLAFNKKRSDDRKAWLKTFDRKRSLNVTGGTHKIGYTRFVNDELIHFSNDDNIRSIPHVMDGLKPSQRKIFWAALKRNLTSEIKVAQLAGYVSENAAYHHGEQSLNGAIVNMAQIFVGSNNLNLLAPNGQFGTRIQGGKDAASPRYIFTALNSIVRSLVKKEDDAVLTHMEDDGSAVEPETYYPVVPMVLINGAHGIGTGFSTDIYPYNPVDIVQALRWRLNGGCHDLTSVSLTPWWFGFTGAVNVKGDQIVTKGVYEFGDHDDETIRIKELPIDRWTEDYKEFLEDMLKEQEEAGKAESKTGKKEEHPIMLKSYKPEYDDTNACFLLHMNPEYYHHARAYPEEFEKKFKLTTSFKTTNMVAFDVDGTIRRFKSAGEIMERFYGARIAKYAERKTYELGRMEREITEIEARLVFIKAVVEKRLVVANADDDVLLAGLQALSLPALSEGSGLSGYEYLLRMRIDRMKASAIAELEAEVAKARAAHAALLSQTPEQMWLTELDEFEAAWNVYSTWRTDLNETAAEDAAAAAVVVKKPRAPRKAKVAAAPVEERIVHA